MGKATSEEASEETTRRRGMPRGRTKGYTKGDPDRDRSEFLEARRKRIAIHGVVGTVSNLYDKIDEELKARDWNWSTLAKKVPCSRQYLVKVTAKNSIPDEFFFRLCQILDWTATEVMERDDESDDEK